MGNRHSEEEQGEPTTIPGETQFRKSLMNAKVLSTAAKEEGRCSENHVGEYQSNIRCYKCGEIGHIARDCDPVIRPNVKRCTKCSKIHDGECRSNIRCHTCDGIGHVSRDCDWIIESNVNGCNHCGGQHASSNCRYLRKNLEEEQRKLELEKKVEKLEGQVDKMLKLSEEDEKRGASSKNPRDNSETKIPKGNSETKNDSFCMNFAPQLDSLNMNPTVFAGTPLQFNRPPPVIQVPMCSQPQNNPPFNQSPNQPFPNVFPNNFSRPLMNLPFPNNQQLQPQQTFLQPHPNAQPTPKYNQCQQQFLPNNENAQSKFNNNPNSPHTSDQTAQFKKPFQNQPNYFPNHQNAQSEFNNSDSPHTSDQTTQFKKTFQNQRNHFNQKQNPAGENQQRGGNNRGRGGFNRGMGGNSAGWKNHNDNNNWRNNNRNRNFDNRGRGMCNRGNHNKEPPLFSGGKSNQTKTDKAEGNVLDSEKNQTERKGVDANNFRPNRNHQGVFRGGIHKERVNIKGRGIHKVQEPNKKDNNSNCDSDSTGTSLETAPNPSEQKKKRRANRHKREKKESSNDSAESTSDKKLEEVHKEDKENQPLSKNNLGEGDILMKYIGTKLPKISDAVTDNVSLYQKVEGVMLMSDPTSDEPILEPATNLLHIIEFKDLHPRAKSFFC